MPAVDYRHDGHTFVDFDSSDGLPTPDELRQHFRPVLEGNIRYGDVLVDVKTGVPWGWAKGYVGTDIKVGSSASPNFFVCRLTAAFLPEERTGFFAPEGYRWLSEKDGNPGPGKLFFALGLDSNSLPLESVSACSSFPLAYLSGPSVGYGYCTPLAAKPGESKPEHDAGLAVKPPALAREKCFAIVKLGSDKGEPVRIREVLTVNSDNTGYVFMSNTELHRTCTFGTREKAHEVLDLLPHIDWWASAIIPVTISYEQPIGGAS